MNGVLKISPISVLYILYINFIISILIDQVMGALAATYFFSLVNLIMLFSVSFLNGKILQTKEVFNRRAILLIICILITVSFFNRSHHYSVLLGYFMVFMYVFFETYTIKRRDFITFINRTYAVYAIASILVFVFLPNTLYVLKDAEEHYATVFGIKYLVLHSIEGFASSIDSYSALVFLINVFLNKEKSRKFFILLSLFCVIYSLKMTPLVSLVSAYIAYLLVRNKYLAIIYLLTIVIVFLIVLNLLFKNPIWFGIDFYTLAFAATHGRSMIWYQQVEVMVKNYHFVDYILGKYNPDLFSIEAFQMTGLKKDYEIANPHNTYLLLFFRMPLLFLFFYFYYLGRIYSSFKRETFVIISFILTASLSNSTLISLGNPVYLMTLLHLVGKKPSNNL